MSKNPVNKKIVSKVIEVSQAIEGYGSSKEETIKEAKALREKYGIKVSGR